MNHTLSTTTPSSVSTHAHPPVWDGVIQTAADLIDRSGVADMVQTWMEDDAAQPELAVNTRTVLIAWVALALENNPLTIPYVARLLRVWLTREAAAAIEVNPDDLRRVTSDEVSAATRRILDVIDYSPLPQTLLRTKHEYEATLRSRVQQKDQLDEKRVRCNTFMNALLQAQLESLPASVSKDHISIALGSRFRNAGVDGISQTTHEDLGDRDLVSEEPDAGFLMRPDRHGHPTVAGYGWEYETAVLVSNDPARDLSVPHIVVGLTAHKPGHMGHAAGELVDELISRGITLDHVIGDRAYFPALRHLGLHQSLREHGAGTVMEYGVRHEGRIQAAVADAVLVDGAWYRADLPEALRTTMSRFRASSRANRTPDGRRVIDPNVQEQLERLRDSQLAARRRYLVDTPNQETGCADVFEQHYEYGSTAWQQAYTGARNANDKVGRDLTDLSADIDGGQTDFRGEAAHWLYTTLIVLATNAGRVRTWMDETQLDEGNGLLTSEWCVISRAVARHLEDAMGAWSRRVQAEGVARAEADEAPGHVGGYWRVNHDEFAYSWDPASAATLVNVRSVDESLIASIADPLIEPLQQQAAALMSELDALGAAAHYPDLSQECGVTLRLEFVDELYLDEDDNWLPLPREGAMLGADATLSPSPRLKALMQDSSRAR